MCAAPGGKSFALAIDMEDRGDILSCDIHPHKLKLIEKGAGAIGHPDCIRTALADGREHHAGVGKRRIDLVVADVPCSGLGIIRKKPDIRYKDRQGAGGAARPFRAAILDNAATYVRPGGVLLYSTCTVLPEENEGVTTGVSGHAPGICTGAVYPAAAHRRLLRTADACGPSGTARTASISAEMRRNDKRGACMTDIKSMTQEELRAYFSKSWESRRSAQSRSFTWLHRGAGLLRRDDQPLQVAAGKAEGGGVLSPRLQVARKQESRLDGTIKYLWEL